MATPDPVLDLTTTRTRPTVRIDHVDYPLRNSYDVTLDAYKTLERISPRIGVLLLRDTLTTDQASELSQLLVQACRIALVAAPAVHATLGDVHRVKIFEVFMQLLTPSLPGAARAELEAPRSNGAKRSPSSSGSTAGASKTGSRRSRAASSRPA